MLQLNIVYSASCAPAQVPVPRCTLPPMVPFARWSLVCCVMLGACTGRDDGKHVFQSPPPAPVASATAQPTQSVPERPIGSGGSTARVASLRLVSTGQPVSLGEIGESFDVVALVSLGAGSSSGASARIELRISGERDTALVTHVAAPIPAVIAHSFRVYVGSSGSGLGDGSYQAQVRFIAAGGRTIASSVPVYFTVRLK